MKKFWNAYRKKIYNNTWLIGGIYFVAQLFTFETPTSIAEYLGRIAGAFFFGFIISAGYYFISYRLTIEKKRT